MRSPVLTIANHHDADAICQVLQSAYQMAWTLEKVHSYFSADYTIIILKHDMALVGVAIIHWLPDGAELIDLAIHADYQKQHLGMQLLNRVIAQVREKSCQTLFLEVRQSNTPAIGLYQKAGFKQIGLRKSYYPAGMGREDAITMKLELLNK